MIYSLHVIARHSPFFYTPCVHVPLSRAQGFHTITETMQGPCCSNQMLLAGLATGHSESSLICAVNGVLDAVDTGERHRFDPAYGSWNDLRESRGADTGDAPGASGLTGLDAEGGAEAEGGGRTMARRAVYVDLQKAMLGSLGAMLEGGTNWEVARRIVQDLAFDKVASLIGVYLDCCDEKSHRSPTPSSSSSSSVIDETDLFVDECEELCAEYLIFIRTLEVRI